MTKTIELLKSQNKDLKSQVSDLKFHERQLEFVINNSGLGIWDWYVQTGEIIFNERWANIIGYTLEELSPVSIETWMKYAHPDDREESDRLLKEHWAGKTEYYACDSRMKHKSGHWVWVYDTGRVIEWANDGVPRRMIGTHLDITKKKESQINLDETNRQIKDWSYLDSLTKIPNRRAYAEKLASEVLAARRSMTSLSLLMIDVDNFKEYNESYGHEKGDGALFTVAKLIKDVLPRKTDFLARFGSDQFVVILPYTTIDGAVPTAKKIRQSIIDGNIEHMRSKFKNILTISIGISSVNTNFDELLSHADEALLQAKKNGRNRYETCVNKMHWWKP